MARTLGIGQVPSFGSTRKFTFDTLKKMTLLEVFSSFIHICLFYNLMFDERSVNVNNEERLLAYKLIEPKLTMLE